MDDGDFREAGDGSRCEAISKLPLPELVVYQVQLKRSREEVVGLKSCLMSQPGGSQLELREEGAR
jgi:hypothetical protein